MLELQLLHFYSTSTHRTLGELFESPDHLWQEYVVQEAFKHDFLLNGILSLAASHKASEEDSLAPTYTLKASEYMTAALQEFRVLLDSPKASSVDAMFAFAVIVSVSTMVQLKPTSITNFKWSCMVDRISDMSECLQGTRKLVTTSGLYQQIGPFYTFLAELQDKQGQAVRLDIKEVLHNLRKLMNETAVSLNPSPYQQQLYGEAIDGLESCWLRRVLAIEWLNDIGRDFLTDLRRKNPFAQLLLAHWGASLQALNSFWYATDIGKNLVSHATEDLVSSNPGFAASIQWTRQYVGLDCG